MEQQLFIKRADITPPSKIKFPKDYNYIGGRGEAIAMVRMTEGNVFRMYFLGEKAKTIDYIIEIVDERFPFFALIQVKTTEKGFDLNGNLLIRVPSSKLDLLLAKPYPTYLVGVDEPQEIVYVAPVFTTSHRRYSANMPPTYQLQFGHKTNIANLNRLKEDIINFSKQFVNHKNSYKTLLTI